VERALLEQDGVRDVAVVGRQRNGEERVHAVLVLEPGATTDEVVRRANAALDDHQRIQSASEWPSGELPRTAGTRKLKRGEVRTWVNSGEMPSGASESHDDPLIATVARFARERAVDDDTSLEELGLSSLERVELLMALEQRFHTSVDEMAFAMARTVGDIRPLIEDEPPRARSRTGDADGTPADSRRAVQEVASSTPQRRESSTEALTFPTWNRSRPAYWARRLSLPTWILPPARLFARLTVSGREHLDGLTGPVVFAANHQSHLDTPVILAALPPRWRYRTSVAMAKEFFKPHFFPEHYGWRARLTNSVNYYLASLFFNAFPLPQREAGTRQTLRYIGALLGEGQSLLIFPEGKRTQEGEINPFRAGIGMIGARLGVPVVPVRLVGVDRVLHQSWKMATPGAVRVTFGAPLRLEGDDYAALAAEVEHAVTALDEPPPSTG
jgi:long-chain acyl-CoA synthetase